jgi:hypothetical protein
MNKFRSINAFVLSPTQDCLRCAIDTAVAGVSQWATEMPREVWARQMPCAQAVHIATMVTFNTEVSFNPFPYF